MIVIQGLPCLHSKQHKPDPALRSICLRPGLYRFYLPQSGNGNYLPNNLYCPYQYSPLISLYANYPVSLPFGLETLHVRQIRPWFIQRALPPSLVNCQWQCLSRAFPKAINV